MAGALFHEAQRLIETGRVAEAARAARELLAKEPGFAEAWLLLALALQRLQQFDAMLEALQQALRIQPANIAVTLKYVEALLLCGQGSEARHTLGALEARAGRDARLLVELASLYSRAGAHEDRLRCAQRAMVLVQNDAAVLACVAAAETACGLLAEAEEHLDALLAQNPRDYGSYYRRSALRRQTVQHNHVAQLEQVLAGLGNDDATGVVPLCYALAREHEDLGHYADSIRYLQRGAATRRARLGYDVADDEQTMRFIAATFDAQRLAIAGTVGSPDAAPIFIVGLPRSGTTLVDRILSSHSSVQSLGEINDFTYAILRLAIGTGDAAQGAPQKLELIGRSARLDFAALGSDYLGRADGYGRTKPHFIDKTPWNFLYVGLIALALPNARIIHLRRHPLDVCFALYKTLFGGGSPYSYDLQDLARYYLAYHDLMAHWRRVLPARLHELDYEQLVQSPEQETRALLDYCGLPFQPECLQFHQNAAPVATASAAQVREPMHTRSVANWKHYAQQLAPLVAALRAGGLALDAAH